AACAAVVERGERVSARTAHVPACVAGSCSMPRGPPVVGRGRHAARATVRAEPETRLNARQALALGGRHKSSEGGMFVLVAGFPAEAFGTNCYVVAPGPGEQCVVVDPGIGVDRRLEEVLA